MKTAAYTPVPILWISEKALQLTIEDCYEGEGFKYYHEDTIDNLKARITELEQRRTELQENGNKLLRRARKAEEQLKPINFNKYKKPLGLGVGFEGELFIKNQGWNACLDYLEKNKLSQDQQAARLEQLEAIYEHIESLNFRKKHLTDKEFGDKELADLGAATYDAMNRIDRVLNKNKGSAE